MNRETEFKKQPDENEFQYIWRLGSLKDSGALDMTWEDLADIFNHELIADETEYLGESAYRKKYQQAKAFYDNVFCKMNSEEYCKKMAEQRVALQKERYKLQTEKLEYNRWLREDARDELFEEKVISAIKESACISNPPQRIGVAHGKREGVLCIADCHFGKQYKIYGVFNEIINEYSPEIFYSRMEQLYNETLEIIRKENLTTIRVYNLGDSVDGFLRNSQIWSLRWGVVDSAVIFGTYMGDWLKKLSEHVHVIYAQTDGNHDELRLLDGKKGHHLCESAGTIIRNCISLKNEQNPNFTMLHNQTGLIYDVICGFPVLGIHGEIKNVTKALAECENIYDTRISYLISGHKHHTEFISLGVKKACIGVGSIIGSDDFSMRIRQCSNATASLLIFEEDKGKVDEHTFVLN